jgi:hypothetical protein
VIIRHDRAAWKTKGQFSQWVLRAILVNFVNPKFWQTRVNEGGFEIERLWRPPVIIPWSRIQCLDLSGLAPLAPPPAYLTGLSPTQRRQMCRRRTIRIMTDETLVRAAYDGAFDKIGYDAPNVLSVADVLEESAERLRVALATLANERGVKLDVICLDV